MSSKTIDMQKLARFMRMTEVVETGSHDGEALSALRMANRLLREAGKDWGDILAPPRAAAPSAPDYRTPPSKRGTARYGSAAPRRDPNAGKGRIYSSDIEPMLAALGSRRNDVGTLMFLASLREFFETNGYLTEAQYEHVKRMHEGRASRSPGGGWRF